MFRLDDPSQTPEAWLQEQSKPNLFGGSRILEEAILAIRKDLCHFELLGPRELFFHATRVILYHLPSLNQLWGTEQIWSDGVYLFVPQVLLEKQLHAEVLHEDDPSSLEEAVQYHLRAWLERPLSLEQSSQDVQALLLRSGEKAMADALYPSLKDEDKLSLPTLQELWLNQKVPPHAFKELIQPLLDLVDHYNNTSFDTDILKRNAQISLKSAWKNFPLFDTTTQRGVYSLLLAVRERVQQFPLVSWNPQKAEILYQEHHLPGFLVLMGVLIETLPQIWGGMGSFFQVICQEEHVRLQRNSSYSWPFIQLHQAFRHKLIQNPDYLKHATHSHPIRAKLIWGFLDHLLSFSSMDDLPLKVRLWAAFQAPLVHLDNDRVLYIKKPVGSHSLWQDSKENLLCSLVDNPRFFQAYLQRLQDKAWDGSLKSCQDEYFRFDASQYGIETSRKPILERFLERCSYFKDPDQLDLIEQAHFLNKHGITLDDHENRTILMHWFVTSHWEMPSLGYAISRIFFKVSIPVSPAFWMAIFIRELPYVSKDFSLQHLWERWRFYQHIHGFSLKDISSEDLKVLMTHFRFEEIEHVDLRDNIKAVMEREFLKRTTGPMQRVNIKSRL